VNYRTRYLNVLRGEPSDRLPFVETAQFNMVRVCSDWGRYLAADEDIHTLFGFDNAQALAGYEPAPVDYYAVPRFEERELPFDGRYRRTIDGRYGRVKKLLPPSPWNPLPVRVFEGHTVRTRQDWLEVKKRFRLSTEGRFPVDWEAWCEHSTTADHPIALGIADVSAIIANLMGQEGEAGMFTSFYERPDLVHEMVEHLSGLSCLCAEKALKEARIDMVMLGSDILPLLSPRVVQEFFLDAHAEVIALAKSFGIDLICLQGRGNMRPFINLYGERGSNGFKYIVETGEDDYLLELLEEHGDGMFFTGCIDGRILQKSFKEIEQEVVRKVALARHHRMILSIHATHILPDISYVNYRHYVECLRRAIME
jgi:hypothetical protein